MPPLQKKTIQKGDNSMKKCKKIAVLGMALALLISGAVNVSAAKYVATVVEEDFASAAASKFVAPGDMNADGSLNADDASTLRKQLISAQGTGSYDAVVSAKGEASKYSDINGDGIVDIRDLVRQKKNTVANRQFISGGTMTVNGNCAYGGDFLSAMGTGATYVVSYAYKSDAPIKVVISGMGEDVVYENAASSTLTTVTEILKTPLAFDANGGVELKIVGTGTVDNFVVTRINMDNELSENWD